MKFTAKFGDFPASVPTNEQGMDGPFRLAVLGDFSGRVARGELGVGDDLATRRAIRFDIDTLDDVIAGFATKLVLPVGKDGAGIEVEIGSIEDLHPDELYEKVELFDELSALRQRLERGSTAGAALTDLAEWAAEHGQINLKPRRSSRANTIPANAKLSDFQKLIDAPVAQVEASDAEDLIAQIVAPYIVAAGDPEADEAIEAVDESISGAMRLILHHPEFQALEAQWRTLDLLARRIDGGGDIRIFLFDVSAEEIAADLAASEDLSQSGLFRLLSEPRLPDGEGAISAAFGLYTFEETPPHAEILGRLAQVAAKAGAAFVTSLSAHYLEVALKDRHHLVVEAWDQLKSLPASQYLALASPRFLLRQPYGQRSDPIYEFEFEEFTRAEGLSGMLWGNPAAIAAILVAAARSSSGASMRPGEIAAIDDMPFYYTDDRYGDQVALPCTERNMTESKIAATTARGLVPAIGPRGRDEVRLGSFQSVAGTPLAGPWQPVKDLAPPPVTPAAPAAQPADEAEEPQEPQAELVPPEVEAPEPAAVEPAPAESEPEPEAADEPAEPEEDVSLDAELDALLADFDEGGDTEEETGDDDLDAELAALLEDL